MYFIESYLKTSACTLKYFDTFFFANLVFSLRNTRMRESNFVSPSYSNHSFQPPVRFRLTHLFQFQPQLPSLLFVPVLAMFFIRLWHPAAIS